MASRGRADRFGSDRQGRIDSLLGATEGHTLPHAPLEKAASNGSDFSPKQPTAVRGRPSAVTPNYSPSDALSGAPSPDGDGVSPSGRSVNSSSDRPSMTDSYFVRSAGSRTSFSSLPSLAIVSRYC